MEMKSKNKIQELIDLGKPFPPKCLYCSETDARKFTLEHLTPTIRGGSNELKNLAISCLRCNHDKGFLTDKEFRFLRNLGPHRLSLFKVRITALIDPFYRVSGAHLQHAAHKALFRNTNVVVHTAEFTEQEMLEKSLSKRAIKKHKE